MDVPFGTASGASPSAGAVRAAEAAAVDMGYGDGAYGGVRAEDVGVASASASASASGSESRGGGASAGAAACTGAVEGADAIQGSVERCIVAAEAAAAEAAAAAQESADRAEIFAFEALLENGTQLYRMSCHASQRAPAIAGNSSASASAAAASVAEALRVAERNALDSAVQKLEQCVELATAAASTASMDAEQLGLEISQLGGVEFQQLALRSPLQADRSRWTLSVGEGYSLWGGGYSPWRGIWG